MRSYKLLDGFRIAGQTDIRPGKVRRGKAQDNKVMNCRFGLRGELNEAKR